MRICNDDTLPFNGAVGTYISGGLSDKLLWGWEGAVPSGMHTDERITHASIQAFERTSYQHTCGHYTCEHTSIYGHCACKIVSGD